MNLTRPAAWLAACLALASSARADVVAVFLKDEKVAKKYEDRLVMINGRPAVLGEPKVGITVEGNNISRNPNVMIELWVPDPDDPSVPAYKADKKGDLEPGSKKTVLRVDGSHLPDKDYATVVMRDDTLPALSREYTLKLELIARYKAERDTFDRTTTDWSAHHVRVVTAMEGLRTWLANTAWPKYAEKYDKEIAKEAKAHKGQAVRARHDKAMASLKTGEVPAKLAELSQELSGGKDKFHVRETQHLRVFFVEPIGADAVEEALKLGEEVIEGFRAQFVDPYLADDYADRIPDDVFQEFLFTPEDADKYVGYTQKFWSIDWSQNREERIEMGGGRVDGSLSTKYRSFRKYNEQLDLQGIVCHQLGHSLAGLHYGPKGAVKQDWLSEALGYYLSFEFLGRNTVTCKSFDKDRSGYVKPERKREEGEKTVGEGRRDLYNEIALSLGKPIDQIARKSLFELDDADLAKSWSFYDYIARAEGKAGQRWLRAAGQHAFDAKTFLAEWRKDAAAILGVGEADAFKAVEDRWRAFATTKGAKGDKESK